MSENLNPKSRGLGRGLNALFDDEEVDLSVRGENSAGEAEASAPSSQVAVGVQKLGIEKMAPSLVQPRMDFDVEALSELAASIKIHGILQPILVRQKRDALDKTLIDDQYEIIAGERRWRAAQEAQLHEVPVLIRDFDDGEAMQIALIENLQRRDLNAVEEALGYKRLMDEHDYTQVQLAELLGRSRPHIANMVRMLTLPEPVLDALRAGDLTAGHARGLVAFGSPMKLAEKIMAEGWSVREMERYLAHVNAKQKGGNSVPAHPERKAPMSVQGQKDADTLALEDELSNALGMKVQIEARGPKKNKGSVQIDFQSLDQLDALLALLKFGDGISESIDPSKRLMQ